MENVKPNLGIEIAGVKWKNPVTVASGTFGSGMEFKDFVDLNKLGAITTKGVAPTPWVGNDTIRVTETASGMLNAIGLQNPGMDVFKSRDIPFMNQYNTVKIVNIVGKTLDEYAEAARLLDDQPIDMLEVNISCPNVKEGGIVFGTDPKEAESVTKVVKAATSKPVIMKLSPNVTSIPEMAKAVEAGGADAISLVNTITGMQIDVNRKTFVLANKTGGLSGPAIKPIAVRMVYEAASAVKLPLIGMGGIMCAEDAIEFILAGATAVSVGTANFNNPAVTGEIVDGIEAYMIKHGIKDINELIGAVK